MFVKRHPADVYFCVVPDHLAAAAAVVLAQDPLAVLRLTQDPHPAHLAHLTLLDHLVPVAHLKNIRRRGI